MTYEMTGEQLAQVVTVINENERVTKIRLTTVGLVDAGRYHYEVYGQNSSSNIDPTNAAVLGLIEKSLMILQDGTIYFDVSTPTIPVDVIYTGA
jgi:ABC-type enterochelin transport system ATPase subunit